jgi:hypothetical protein
VCVVDLLMREPVLRVVRCGPPCPNASPMYAAVCWRALPFRAVYQSINQSREHRLSELAYTDYSRVRLRDPVTATDMCQYRIRLYGYGLPTAYAHSLRLTDSHTVHVCHVPGHVFSVRLRALSSALRCCRL